MTDFLKMFDPLQYDRIRKFWFFCTIVWLLSIGLCIYTLFHIYFMYLGHPHVRRVKFGDFTC